MWVQERMPNVLKIKVVRDMHLKVRFHKKNVAKMEEKEKMKKK